jgi:peroxiredoxin
LQNLNKLPDGLPIPVDDGACRHLLGQHLPDIALKSTNFDLIYPAQMKGWLVVYCYPKMGHPDRKLPEGWDSIAGARGCTPQSCAFRDSYHELQKLNAQVFGLSAQDSDYQKEAVDRLHLPYPLLSDNEFKFSDALNLPSFEFNGSRLNKRLTLIAYDGVIRHYFYPVFPPDKNADDVIVWLSLHV